MIVAASEIAKQHGVTEKTVRKWHQKGWIPGVPYGRQTRFDDAEVAQALEARKKASQHGKLCSACGRDLPLGAFNLVKDKRKGHAGEKVPASDCRECRKAQRIAWRARKAEEAGRDFSTRAEARADREMLAAQKREQQAQRKAEAKARRMAREAQLVAEGREGLTMTQEETRRSVERQRERYNTDSDYRAAIQAKKIRRKRAMAGTKVEPVSRERVARRDGWRCGICGGRVTRNDWSLDHIVPLSRGGSHTYGNVTLAHNLCNIRRGVGRLPVQAPLFATP